MLPNPNASVIATVRQIEGLTWSGTASGTDRSRASDASDSAVQPVRIASVGKTFTAATILRLVEDGRLGVDDPVDRHLTLATVELLAGDGYDLSSMTIRHLLQHTSGLFDYAFGEGSPMLDRALSDRSHRWTRDEQVALAISVGDPLGAPGEAFHYSDTGYIVLGEIIEQVVGRPYHEVMRDLLAYDRLGLGATWMESGEQPPAGAAPIARSFFAETELTDLDFSIDAFGGGGLAAATNDVARFFEALLAGKVLKPETLALMTEVPDTNRGLSEFGVQLGDGASGLYRLDLGSLGTCWSHRGFLGTIAVTCPDVGATVVVTTNTALTDPLPLAVELLTIATRP